MIDVAITLINIIIFMDYLVATGRVFEDKLICEYDGCFTPRPDETSLGQRPT